MIAERAPHIRSAVSRRGCTPFWNCRRTPRKRPCARRGWQGPAFDGLRPYRHPDSAVPPRDGLVGYGKPPDHAFAAALDALCRALPDPPQNDR
ncbi:hypothetical protein BKA00_002432 [Actinomadura coerulea]|uniref:Uncharacterized protein n=1 Tax=Actinomadura coerulea TaxID=46159 RepID=A0A7X0FXG9_9ACTN|nr:hypothetical protein [Actinomadura coerulea]MBB6395518.1 hypothetical protein [Actinomadura coerulea]